VAVHVWFLQLHMELLPKHPLFLAVLSSHSSLTTGIRPIIKKMKIRNY
jgi:hypothetical protein